MVLGESCLIYLMERLSSSNSTIYSIVPPGDGDSDDSDDRFAKRLRKFLRSREDEDKHDDKPKVKEADSIKIPAFPTPESYRNWRIKTREAVVAASTISQMMLSNG